MLLKMLNASLYHVVLRKQIRRMYTHITYSYIHTYIHTYMRTCHAMKGHAMVICHAMPCHTLHTYKLTYVEQDQLQIEAEHVLPSPKTESLRHSFWVCMFSRFYPQVPLGFCFSTVSRHECAIALLPPTSTT